MKPIIINKRYCIHRKIGSGGFGLVYMGVDLDTNKPIAIKLMPITAQANDLLLESNVYKALQRGLGFPKLLWFGQQEDYRVLVTELLGPSLEDLFQFCGCRLSLKTVLLLADQAIRRLEYMHNRKYIHCDVKPENFLLGTGKEGHLLYAIDFGVAKPLITDHDEPLPDQVFAGTTVFASINSLRRLEQSRRDDLEALGYTLIYFLRGQLPWENIEVGNGEDIVAITGERKANMTLENLCAHLPAAFLKYMQTVRDLRFLEKPDYRRLRLLFTSLFHQKGYKNDNVFHWTEWRYRQLRGESFPALGF